MNTSMFDDILKQQILCCVETLTAKACEYATEDRLHNFKTAAEMQGITPIQALAGMMAKHTVSVYDMCAASRDEIFPVEMWEEKITDHINYLILLRALVHEDRQEEELK